MTKRQVVIVSPFLIILVNFALALIFKPIIGKWSFIPMISMGWVLWLFFVLKYSDKQKIKDRLKPTNGFWGWKIFTVFIGILPLPLFLLHYDALSGWEVILPWALLALINPWIEEFYWRGLLLDHTQHWPKWAAILFTATLFSMNHIAFGINSEVNKGYDVAMSTFIMGIVWALTYSKTKSLRWVIFAHFLVDFFNLSAAAFLDLFDKGGWQ